MGNSTRIHGWTVQIIDENDGAPRLLASGLHFGGEPKWYPLDAEALASFTQRTHPPFGHIWQSSRDLAEDAARATRGTVCAIEEDAAGAITIREVDPLAEAAAEAREAIAHLFDEAEPICTGCGAVTPPGALTMLHREGCPIVAAAATDVGQELLEKAQRVFDKAVAEEREACAKIAAEWVAMTQWDADEPGEQIAILIRARGAR